MLFLLDIFTKKKKFHQAVKIIKMTLMITGTESKTSQETFSQASFTTASEFNSSLIMCSTINDCNYECPDNQVDTCHTNTIANVDSIHHTNISGEEEEEEEVETTITNSNSSMKRQQGSLTLSAVEAKKNAKMSQEKMSVSSYLIEQYDQTKLIDNQMCSTCISYNVCSCCNDQSSSTRTDSSFFASLKPAMTNSTVQESTFDRNDLLSSTPMFSETVTSNHGNLYQMRSFFHSTLLSMDTKKSVKKTKSDSMKGLNLLKSCVLAQKTRKNPVKKADSKNYKFKMVSTATGLKLKSEAVAKKPKKVPVAKRRFPRTSSFNSNEDERDMCDLNDFDQLESCNTRQPMAESFLPVGIDKNGFNNLGDFVVWYV